MPGVAVRAALGKLDGNARAGSVVAAPGVVLVNDISLPGRGFECSRAYAFWSAEGLRLTMDSVLIVSCIVELDHASGEPARGRGRNRDIPLLILDEARLTRAGSDTTTFTGRVSAPGGRTSIRGIIGGRWGTASVEADGGGPGMRFEAEFLGCTGVPFFTPDLHRELSGMSFSGSLSGNAMSDSVHLEGTAFESSRAGTEIPFELSFSERTSLLEIDTGLEAAEMLIEKLLLSFDPGAWISLRPAGGIHLAFEDGAPCRFDLEAGMDSAAVWSGRISPDTIVFSGAFSASGTVESGRLVVDSGTATLGRLPVSFRMEAVTGDRDILDVDLWNDGIDGADITASIPEPLLGTLRGTVLSGRASLSVHLRVDVQHPDSSDLSIEVDAGGLRVERCPVDVRSFVDGGSCRMRDSWGNSRIIELSPALNDSFVPLQEMPPWFEPLLCCAEDGSFRRHDGFSPYHIRNSLIADVRARGFVRGASTITMQLARNLFLTREKTLARKLQEVFLTWRIETLLSKDRILEIYSNVVELGPDVFGFAEAARYYFDTDIRDLGVREMAYLISILPGPRIYHAYYTRGSVPEWWERYLDLLIESARRREGIPEEEAALAPGGVIRFN